MSNLKVPTKTAERKTERIEILATKSQVKKIDAHAKKTGLNRSQYLLARGEKRTYTMARHLPDPDYKKRAGCLKATRSSDPWMKDDASDFSRLPPFNQ